MLCCHVVSCRVMSCHVTSCHVTLRYVFVASTDGFLANEIHVIRVKLTCARSWLVDVAEHSFRPHFCWCNIARAQRFQNTNMPSIERSFYLLTPTLPVLFFSIIERSVLMALVFYYKDMYAKNPAILSFCLLPKKTHAQLLKKLRNIALAETCRFLTIQSLEFQEIRQKKSIRDHVNDLSRKIWILT